MQRFGSTANVAHTHTPYTEEYPMLLKDLNYRLLFVLQPNPTIDREIISIFALFWKWKARHLVACICAASSDLLLPCLCFCCMHSNALICAHCTHCSMWCQSSYSIEIFWTPKWFSLISVQKQYIRLQIFVSMDPCTKVFSFFIKLQLLNRYECKIDQIRLKSRCRKRCAMQCNEALQESNKS